MSGDVCTHQLRLIAHSNSSIAVYCNWITVYVSDCAHSECPSVAVAVALKDTAVLYRTATAPRCSRLEHDREHHRTATVRDSRQVPVGGAQAGTEPVAVSVCQVGLKELVSHRIVGCLQ